MIRRRSVGILIVILMLCMPAVCASGGSLTVTLPEDAAGGRIAIAKTALDWATDLESEAVLEEAESLGYSADQEVAVTDGTSSFDNLDPGIYYVWQTEPCTGYDNFRGFLVRIESDNAGVEAVPKMHSRTVSPVTPAENNVPSESKTNQGVSSEIVSVTKASQNVSTGFDDNRLLWIGAAALMALITLAVVRDFHQTRTGEHSVRDAKRI